jgi:glycosyltransferase involved in cell wall biosynthesis
VIYHGTDPHRFTPPTDRLHEKARLRHELGLPADGWHWLFVGEAIKGLTDVVAQLPAFPAARLIVASSSDLAACQRQARRLDVLQRLHLMGQRNDVERLHRAADVFVYPSRYDAFGLVVLEAMASGLPVIAGRNTGVAELIEDGMNGLLCNPDQPGTMTAALRSLAPETWRAEQLGIAARRTAELHGWDTCAQATWECHDSLLSSAAP